VREVLPAKAHQAEERHGGMSGCFHGHESRICPISKATCPGECIYSYVLENISVGIIVLDVNNETVIFQNDAAAELFGAAVKPRDYRAIWSLFPFPEKFSPTEESSIPKTLVHGEKLLGYTLYHIPGGYLWLFVRDITEKKQEEEKLLRLVAAVESTAEAISIMHKGNDPVCKRCF